MRTKNVLGKKYTKCVWSNFDAMKMKIPPVGKISRKNFSDTKTNKQKEEEEKKILFHLITQQCFHFTGGHNFIQH